MARKHLKAGALTAPLPPVIVTVGDMENANALTVAWTGILSTIPPRTYVSVRPSRHSHAILKESGEFVINLPTAKMAREVDYIGIYTGAKVDKFAATGLHKCPSEQVKAPTVEECPIALECRVTEVVSMGTHDVFMADIVGVSCDERILDGAGKMHFERANLLAYAHGEYFALGERLGEFGFSTKKKPARKAAPKTVDKRSASDDTADTAAKKDNTEEKKPFYLTAPRGRSKKGSRGGRK